MEEKKKIVEKLWKLSNMSVLEWDLKQVKRFSQKAVEKLDLLNELGSKAPEDDFLFEKCNNLKKEVDFLSPILRSLKEQKLRKEKKNRNYLGEVETWRSFLRRLEHDYIEVDGEKVLVSSLLSYKSLMHEIRSYIVHLENLSKEFETNYIKKAAKKDRNRAANTYTNFFLEFLLLIDIFLLRGWRVLAISFAVLAIAFPFIYKRTRVNPKESTTTRYSVSLMAVLFWVTFLLSFFFLVMSLKDYASSTSLLNFIISHPMFYILFGELVGSVLLGRLFALIRFGTINKTTKKVEAEITLEGGTV